MSISRKLGFLLVDVGFSVVKNIRRPPWVQISLVEMVHVYKPVTSSIELYYEIALLYCIKCSTAPQVCPT